MFVPKIKQYWHWKKIFLFILFLGKSLSVSVGECRWVFKKIVCDLSCRPVVESASWLSVKKCRRWVAVSASCLSVSCHRFHGCIKQFKYIFKAWNSTFIEIMWFIITTSTELMSQISNLIPSDRRRLNRVWAFAQNNKGPADHSKVQIAEGKAQTKKLVYILILSNSGINEYKQIWIHSYSF